MRDVVQVLCEWDSYILESAQRAQSCSCRCQRAACCSFNQVCSSLMLTFAYTNHLLVLLSTLCALYHCPPFHLQLLLLLLLLLLLPWQCLLTLYTKF